MCPCNPTCLREQCGFISGPVLKNVGERFIAKHYCLVGLLPVVSKVFEEFVNNKIVDHLEKCGEISTMVLGLLNQLQIF